jgi:twinkle protein
VEYLNSEEVDFAAYLKATETQEKIREARVYLEKLKNDLLNPKTIPQISMPWGSMLNQFDFKTGEVTLYAGGNGGGKSLITGQIAMSLVKQNQKVCLMSFEMKPERTLERMTRQFSCENLSNPLLTNRKSLIVNCMDRLMKFTDKKMWLYDQQGTVTSDQVIAVSRYCAMELGINHIFIDSLMKCVRGEDDYNSQKYFIDELTALARDHQVHIHVVHHIRKGDNVSDKPNKFDIRGASAITDMVDNVFIVFRNKAKELARKENKKVEFIGKVAKLPKGVKAANGFNFLESIKISKSSIWYLMVERQDNELQMVKYNHKQGVDLNKFITGLKKYYSEKYSSNPQVLEKIKNIVVDGNDKFSMIKNIPTIELEGKKMISRITEDLIKLLSK